MVREIETLHKGQAQKWITYYQMAYILLYQAVKLFLHYKHSYELLAEGDFGEAIYFVSGSGLVLSQLPLLCNCHSITLVFLYSKVINYIGNYLVIITEI